MTTTGLAVVLAALMMLLVRVGAVRPLGLLVCVALGIVLTLTPIGPDLTSTHAVRGREIRVVAGGEPVMGRGEKSGRGPIHLRAASVRIPLTTVILGQLGRALGRVSPGF